MSSRTYRLLVLGCMLSWFLAGLHAPALHALAGHGHVHAAPLLMLALLAAAGAVAGWALLRAPRPGA